MPEPLPDRILLLSLLGTLLLVFSVVVITVQLAPGELPLQWREPAAGGPAAGLL